jgi:hypothetical protein
MSATSLSPDDHPHRVSSDYPARAEHRHHYGALRDSPSRPPGSAHLAAFPSWSAEICASDTVLWGPIRDRAALHGVLAQVESFGLELIELRRLPARAIGLPDAGDAELPRAKKGFDHE